MRTTIRVDPRLLAEAKKLAAETNRSLTKVVEDALREVVGRRKHRPRGRISLTIVGGRGVNPGIDVDDSASLLAAMERRGPA
jgi:Bacterial antitoxin of type II TA system, VapB